MHKITLRSSKIFKSEKESPSHPVGWLDYHQISVYGFLLMDPGTVTVHLSRSHPETFSGMDVISGSPCVLEYEIATDTPVLALESSHLHVNFRTNSGDHSFSDLTFLQYQIPITSEPELCLLS